MECKEIEIDILDIIYSLARKWRRILIWMLVFIILLNGFSVMKAVKSNKTAVMDPETALEQELNASKAVLSLREVQETEQSFTTYMEMYEAIEKETAYCDNSLVMSFDSQNVPTYSIQYMITSDETSGFVNSIISVYENQLVNADVLEQVTDVLGGDYQYPQELIFVSNAAENNNSSLIEQGTRSGILAISVVADSEENCESIGKLLENRMNEFTDELQKTYGQYSVKKVSESYMLTSNSNVSDIQSKEYNTLASLRNNINNLKNGMIENQKKYFNVLWQVEQLKMQQESDAEADGGAAVSVQYLNVKYILVGAFLGLFFSIIYYVFAYLLSRKMRITDELCKRYSIPLLGEALHNTDEKMSGIDRAIKNRFKGTAAKGTLAQQCERIAQELSMRVEDGDSILMTGTVQTEEMNHMKACLKSVCEKNNCHIIMADSIVNSTDALSKLSEVQAVVLVEKTGKSVNKDIYKEVELCKRYEVPIMGAVIVQA